MVEVTIEKEHIDNHRWELLTRAINSGLKEAGYNANLDIKESKQEFKIIIN